MFLMISQLDGPLQKKNFKIYPNKIIYMHLQEGMIIKGI
jgi:hypothetical protein